MNIDTNDAPDFDIPDFSESLKKLKSIATIECNNPLVDLRHYPFELQEDPSLDSFETSKPHYLRELVADKLVIAQSLLPNGWKFKILSAWRSKDEQQALLLGYIDYLRETYPKLSAEECRVRGEAMIAPIDHPILLPPHCTGGAVDLTIVDQDNEPINLGIVPGSSYEYFSADASSLFYELNDVNDEIKNNRMILRETLNILDFCYCDEEWWDYNYGNNIWAMSKGYSQAFFGYVEPS